MLRVYSTAEYKATEILRGAIQGFLGEWNLAKIRGPNEGEGLTRFTVGSICRVSIIPHIDCFVALGGRKQRKQASS
jgi:hypothetical protein